MKTSLIKNNKGYTVIELVVASLVMALLAIGCMDMLIGAMTYCDDTNNQAYSDSDAVVAMQKMVMDIREAKSFTVLDPVTGTNPQQYKRLELQFPSTQAGNWSSYGANTYYNRTQTDAGSVTDYYVSDSTGTIGHTGTILWENKGGVKANLADHISGVFFETDAGSQRAVRITVNSSNRAVDGNQTTSLVERVVYLRNY